MPKVIVDPTYQLLKKGPEDQSPRYREYRRKWVENPKKHIVEEFPIHLDLESTSGCNLKCPMCFQSYNPPKPGFMDFNLFKKIIDEGAEKGLCSVKLQYRGEPLLHPKLVDMVRYAKEKGVIEVMFNTNATLLTEDKSRAFVEAGLDKIVCSIDGYTKEVYEKIRVGAKFETILNNIKTLQRVKKEMGSKKPIVRVQMVDTPWNHDQIKGYLRFWGKIADQVGIEEMQDWRLDKNAPDTPTPEFCCPQLWQRLVILWDGKVVPCCGDHYQRMVIGDAATTKISEIWLGDKMNQLRELHMRGEAHKINICKSCDDRLRVLFGKGKYHVKI